MQKPKNIITNPKPVPEEVLVPYYAQTQTEDASLKSAIMVIGDYLLELIKKWYVYVIFLGAFIYAAHQYLEDQTVSYVGVASFMTNTDGGSSMSKVMQVMGQFGGGGGGGGGGGLASDRLSELLLSRKMVYSALLKTVTIKGKTDKLFNHYLALFNMRRKNPELRNFRFNSSNIRSFSFKENKVASQIYGAIVRQYVNISDNQNGIIKVVCESPSEPFCKEFPEKLIRDLKVFYESAMIGEKKQTYKDAQWKTDSLEQALYAAENNIATFIDKNKGALRAGTVSGKKMVKQMHLENQAELTSVRYEESLKRLEIANLDLEMSKPLLEFIDFPAYPLGKHETDRTFIFMIAIATALGISTLVIFFNKLIWDALRE